MAIQKHEDGSFTILQLACTHTGHPLTKTGDNYYCTMHGSRFNHDGKVLKGPAENPLRQIKYMSNQKQLTFVLPS
jgi:cytochrome b6-f complex iron-sulfur subunit